MEKRILVLLYILTGSSLTVFGQAEMASRDSAAKAMQRDLIDVYDHLFHKSADTSGKVGKFRNAPFPAVGYTQVTGFAAVLSDRLDFYTGDSANTNETDILSSVTYSQYNQIIAQSFSSIWTKGNKYNILTDWRYMKYPSTTFGLGGHTQYSDGYTIDFSYLKLHTTILRHISGPFYAGVGYYFDHFWSIREVSPPPGVVTSFERYGLTSTETGSGPVLRLLYDSRANPVNPANGLYASVAYHPSFEFLGSTGNWGSMQIDLRKYIKLRPDGRNILALWNFEWLSVGGKTPYLLLPSTGWDDQFNTGRGYIQGRYRGPDMAYLEAEDRFAISRNGMFGGVIFANVESFKKDLASQYNTFAPGYGTGIRIKLNKHSGANICVDYARGLDASNNVSVNLGEVF